MRVGRVVRPDPPARDGHQPGIPQDLEVVRNGWLRQVKALDDVAGAEPGRLPGNQPVHLQPGRIGECLQHGNAALALTRSERRDITEGRAAVVWPGSLVHGRMVPDVLTFINTSGAPQASSTVDQESPQIADHLTCLWQGEERAAGRTPDESTTRPSPQRRRLILALIGLDDLSHAAWCECHWLHSPSHRQAE